MGRLAGHFSNPVIGGEASEGTMQEESVSAKQQSVTHSLEKKRSLQVRYVYVLVFFLTNLFTWFVRDYGHKILTGLSYTKFCGSKDSDCFHEGGVLRVSFGCFMYFLLMCVSTFRVKKLNDARNLWHSRWWSLKFVLYLISMMVSFVMPADFIQLYGEVARAGAGLFLVLQLISVIHFITWCNDHSMLDSEAKQCGLIGLFFSTILYIAAFCGIGLMYLMYAPDTSCILNIFLIAWTTVLVIVTMIASLHSKVNRGLLSSSIMGSYIVFLCWSTIQSEPPIEKCNMRKEVAENVNWITVISFLIAICAIVMSTFSTGIDSKAFQFRKDGGQSEDDIPYSYDLFHFIFSIGAMHFAMLFINWELDHPTRKWSIDVGWVSTLVKIINEWLAASIFFWKLISPVLMKDEALDNEGPVRLAISSV